MDSLGEFAPLLRALPCLLELDLETPEVPAAAVAAIGSACKQLTHLELFSEFDGCAVRALAAHLSQLSALKELHMLDFGCESLNLWVTSTLRHKQTGRRFLPPCPSCRLCGSLRWQTASWVQLQPN